MNGVLQLPDGGIYYEVDGSGPALVFAHGLGGNYLSWWQQVPFFAKTHTCVTFSHRGFWPNTALHAIPTPSVFADDLSALIEHLQLGNVSLVAQSMGGWTCLEYALRHQSRVSALVMASSTGTLNFAALECAHAGRLGELPAMSVPEKGYLGELPAVSVPEKGRLGEWTAWSVQEKQRLGTLGLIAATGARMAEEQPSLHYLYRHISDMTPVAFKEAVRSVIHAARTLPSEKFAALRVPVIFVVGEEDLVFPPMAAAVAASLIHDASIVTLPKTGHSGYFERAEAFNKIVFDFLSTTALPIVKKKS